MQLRYIRCESYNPSSWGRYRFQFPVRTHYRLLWSVGTVITPNELPRLVGYAEVNDAVNSLSYKDCTRIEVTKIRGKVMEDLRKCVFVYQPDVGIY